jgi:hypothetical protein
VSQARLGIYVISKIAYASMWISYRDQGYPIISRWLDVDADPKDPQQMQQLWEMILEDCQKAVVAVICLQEGETIKGGKIEIGAILGRGGRIFLVGTDPEIDEDPRFYSQALERCTHLDEAMEKARAAVEEKRSQGGGRCPSTRLSFVSARDML